MWLVLAGEADFYLHCINKDFSNASEGVGGAVKVDVEETTE